MYSYLSLPLYINFKFNWNEDHYIALISCQALPIGFWLLKLATNVSLFLKYVWYNLLQHLILTRTTFFLQVTLQNALTQLQTLCNVLQLLCDYFRIKITVLVQYSLIIQISCVVYYYRNTLECFSMNYYKPY